MTNITLTFDKPIAVSADQVQEHFNIFLKSIHELGVESNSVSIVTQGHSIHYPGTKVPDPEIEKPPVIESLPESVITPAVRSTPKTVRIDPLKSRKWFGFLGGK